MQHEYTPFDPNNTMENNMVKNKMGKNDQHLQNTKNISVIFFLDVLSPGSLNTDQAQRRDTPVILYWCPTLIPVAGSSSSSPLPMHAS